MPHRLDDVAAARLALGADQGRALTDAAQRLAQVARTTDERRAKLVLRDVVLLVSRGQHLALVDEVDADGLEHPGLQEVPDAHLRHHRNRHRLLNALDHLDRAHARHTAFLADVRGDALEGHDGRGPRLLGELRLVGRGHVHDHAALEHLRETDLDLEGLGGGSLRVVSVGLGHGFLRLMS